MTFGQIQLAHSRALSKDNSKSSARKMMPRGTYINLMARSGVNGIECLSISHRLYKFCEDIASPLDCVAEVSLKRGPTVIINILNVRVWNVLSHEMLSATSFLSYTKTRLALSCMDLRYCQADVELPKSDGEKRSSRK